MTKSSKIKRKGRRASVDGPHPVDEHVGRRVRQRRIAVGMTQTELANALGVAFQQLQKYEKGINRVSASRLWMVSQILGTPVQWFFDGYKTEDGESADETDAPSRLSLEFMRDINACPPHLQKAARALVRAMASGAPAGG